MRRVEPQSPALIKKTRPLARDSLRVFLCLAYTAEVRYRTDQGPNEAYPYAESMHQMLTLTMVLSILIGVAFIVAGSRGKILWMKVWGAGLLLLAIAYLVADYWGFV